MFEKSSEFKFHENPSIESGVVKWGQTDGRTDLTKLMVGFGNLVKALKNQSVNVV